jgi:hypothetical protein
MICSLTAIQPATNAAPAHGEISTVRPCRKRGCVHHKRVALSPARDEIILAPVAAIRAPGLLPAPCSL